MTAAMDERSIACPYCGEAISILLDLSAGAHRYIEDCEICCRPRQVDFTTADGGLEALDISRAD